MPDNTVLCGELEPRREVVQFRAPFCVNAIRDHHICPYISKVIGSAEYKCRCCEDCESACELDALTKCAD